jgi:CheY-like chemotaxis protein
MTCIQKAATQASLDRVLPIVHGSMQARTKRLLIASTFDQMRKEISDYLSASDLELVHAGSEAELLEIVSRDPVDGIVLDWMVSEIGGLELIELLQSRLDPFVPPLLILGRSELDTRRAAELHRLSRVSAVRYAPSLERLLDESMVLLHRRESNVSRQQQGILAAVRQVDPMLAGKKILVIDDDLRNIFALTSVLEQHDLTVLHAETGRAGIEILEKNRDVDLVLTDIMMPEMDGYATVRVIRQIPDFKSLPIIALTAKAMKGDREKCLQAGASDYVTKPVDLNHLFSVMRVWLAGLTMTDPLSSGSGPDRSSCPQFA